MSTPTMTTRRVEEIPVDRIQAGGNVRDLDGEHVSRLAASMKVRGLLTPIDVVAVDGERFALVAGAHRLAAAGELGWSTIAAQIGEQAEGRSGDQGAENILRKQLTPLEEARQVEKMLGDGYTVDGAATVLGWSKRRVTARRRILELPGDRADARRHGRDPGRRDRHAAGDPDGLAEARRADRRGARRGLGRGQPAGRAAGARPGLAGAPGALAPPRRAVRRAGRRHAVRGPGGRAEAGQEDERALRGGQGAARPAGPLRVRAAAGAARRGRARPGARRRRAAGARPHAGDPRPRRLPRARQDGGGAHRRGPARPRGRARDRAARAQGRRRRQARAHAARGGRRRAPRAGARVHPPRAQRQPRPRRRAARRARRRRPREHGRGAVLRVRAARARHAELPRHRRPRRAHDRRQRHPPGARRAPHDRDADA